VGAGLDHLREHRPDVVLLDLGNPDAPGTEACARLLHAAPGTPIVLLADLGDEAEAEAALSLGAHDYLVKGRFTAAALGRAIRYAMDRHRLQARLDELSLSDALTGLANRRGFAVRAEDDLRRARRTGTPFVLAVADVDGLTAINAAHGRLEGDRALRDAASVLRSTFRESDVVARVGGDEFALLLRDAGPDCQERARRAQSARRTALAARHPPGLHPRAGGGTCRGRRAAQGHCPARPRGGRSPVSLSDARSFSSEANECLRRRTGVDSRPQTPRIAA
jgi:diguanylate cyclase (GGDEF)-like protein